MQQAHILERAAIFTVSSLGQFLVTGIILEIDAAALPPDG
jgi:hypothetical protein